MRRIHGALAFVAALASAGVARADEPRCTRADDEGRPFATCFDLGNRLRLDATTAGVGGGIDLRHRVATDDPTIHYRLEHVVLDGASGASERRLSVYSLRFVRHAEGSALVIPTRPPTRVPLPFDAATEIAIGDVRVRAPSSLADVGVVRGAVLADLARAPDFSRRIAVGAVARWDTEIDRDARRVVRHDVAPFTLATLSLHAESNDGLFRVDASAEGGVERRGETSLRPSLRAMLAAERVVLAVDDRPLTLYAAARYDDRDGAPRAELGVRFAVVGGAR